MLKAILVTVAISTMVLGCAKKEEPAAANAPVAPPPTASQSPQGQAAEPSKTPAESGKDHVNAGREKAKDAGKEFAAGALDLLKAKVDEEIDRNNKDNNRDKVTSSSEKPKEPAKQ
jgi:hypothetical protein